jgi:hypothetical protein
LGNLWRSSDMANFDDIGLLEARELAGYLIQVTDFDSAGHHKLGAVYHIT